MSKNRIFLDQKTNFVFNDKKNRSFTNSYPRESLKIWILSKLKILTSRYSCSEITLSFETYLIRIRTRFGQNGAFSKNGIREAALIRICGCVPIWWRWRSSLSCIQNSTDGSIHSTHMRRKCNKMLSTITKKWIKLQLILHNFRIVSRKNVVSDHQWCNDKKNNPEECLPARRRLFFF